MPETMMENQVAESSYLRQALLASVQNIGNVAVAVKERALDLMIPKRLPAVVLAGSIALTGCGTSNPDPRANCVSGQTREECEMLAPVDTATVPTETTTAAPTTTTPPTTPTSRSTTTAETTTTTVTVTTVTATVTASPTTSSAVPTPTAPAPVTAPQHSESDLVAADLSNPSTINSCTASGNEVLIHNGPSCDPGTVIASETGPFREQCTVWVVDPNSDNNQKTLWVVTEGGYASAAVLPAVAPICTPDNPDPAGFWAYQ
jgi:hypothetical protein